MEENIKTNSLKAWVLAARPVTLTAAAVPVLLGIVFAWRRVITLGKTTIYMAESDMVYTGMPHIEYDLTCHSLPPLRMGDANRLQLRQRLFRLQERCR